MPKHVQTRLKGLKMSVIVESVLKTGIFSLTALLYLKKSHYNWVTLPKRQNKT